MTLGNGARVGSYVVDARLDTGGMGEVYLATDSRLRRRVALKILRLDTADPTARRARFAREARALSGLSHSHICPVYDTGEHDGLPYLVMEYLEGETLAARLRRGPIPVAEALRIGIEVADALHCAHWHGIVHRDLKPANVMLTAGGVKLVDFGLARLDTPKASGTSSGQPCETESLTEEGAIVGTLHYMAPEQLEGGRVDGRADIFALGAILYEIATGRQAFDGESRARIIAAVLERTPPSIVEVCSEAGLRAPPPLLDRIVSRCLAKHPDDRWQTACDLKEALAWVAGVTMPTRSTKPASTVRRRGLAWWSAAGLFAALAVAAGALATRDSEPGAIETRFEIHPPDNVTFNPSSAFLTLSPDGRYLAFVASSRNAGSQLWLRARDDIVARPLPGTEDAYQPFWSPDSRVIAFGAGREVKAIDVTTSEVWRLADMVFLAGAWSPRGVIVLAPAPNEGRLSSHGLHRIAATGGVPEPLTVLDAGRAETSHGWPHFLPDGRTYLYIARSNQTRLDGTVMAGSIESDRRTVLFTSDSHVAYANGHVFFMRGNSLLAQPFEVSTLRTTGNARTVADNVERNPESRKGAFSVSADGVVAYRGVGRTELAWVDRRGVPLESIGEPGHYSNPALSRDGQRLAVERTDPKSGTADVWIFEVRSGLGSRLTHTGAERPLWSPVSDLIVYRTLAGRPDAPAWRRALVSRATTGTAVEERLLPDVSPFDSPVSWASDGRALVYTNFDSRASPSLWMVPLDADRAPVPLTHSPFDEIHGQVSPDGRWLAYVSNEAGEYAVYVRPFPSGAGKWRVSAGGSIEPYWRGDGRELYYIAADRSLMAVRVSGSGAFLAAPPERLFGTRLSTWINPGYTRNQYVATGDGRRFLLVQPSGTAPAITLVIDWTARLPENR